MRDGPPLALDTAFDSRPASDPASERGHADDRPRTLFAKLWDRHRVADLPGDAALIAIDRLFLHERTGAAALKALAARGRAVTDPGRVVAIMDHVVSTRPGRTGAATPALESFLTDTRAAARAAGIRIFDVGDAEQGITHVVAPERGMALPGLTIVCPDSHTCTQGAVGALAWGIGSSEAEHALATGCLRVTRPKAMRVRMDGWLASHVTAKDLALGILMEHGSAGGQGYAVEYAGEAVRALPMEARLTLCNMATEFAAFSATIAPDDATFAWLKGAPEAPAGAAWDRARQHWATLASDPDAAFDAEIAVDARAVRPMVSWGTSPMESAPLGAPVPADARPAALAYMGLETGRPVEGLAIGAAFIGSCTNARLADLRAAAAVLRGRRVAPGVTALVVPGSTAVKRAAEAEGLDRVFVAAGFEWRESGCSLCFYAGGEGFAPGSRTISSTNRNFEGRQGPGVRTHIASPAVVAASAVMGRIADPRSLP